MAALKPTEDAGLAAQWTQELLVALQVNTEGQGSVYPYKDTDELQQTLITKCKDIKKFSNFDLVRVIDKLNQCMFQLRAWYTHTLGSFLLEIMEAVLAAKSLPSNGGQDSLMMVLKLLEGTILICTVNHEPHLVAKTLEKLIQARRLPPNVNARMESCVVYWSNKDDWHGVPEKVPINCKTGLNAQLTDRAEQLPPSRATVANMEDAKHLIERVVKDKWPDAGVDFFGSAINGFELEGSDLDCVIQLPLADLQACQERVVDEQNESSTDPSANLRRKQQSAAMAAVNALESVCLGGENSASVRVVEKVLGARVPLLKLKTVQSKVAIDVSFNNTLPLYNSRLLKAYANLDPRVPPLGRLVKFWAKKRSINDAKEGTLSSYAHILLLIHFLQHEGLLPNLQDKSMIEESKWPSVGTVEKVDGCHDVWFMDPENEECKAELDQWLENRSEFAKTATLEGLLRNFYRYFAYEIAIHHDVVSITSTKPLDKIEYFRQVAAAVAAANADDGDRELEASEAVDDDVGGGLDSVIDDEREAEEEFPDAEGDVEEVEVDELCDYYTRADSESEEDPGSRPSGMARITEVSPVTLPAPEDPPGKLPKIEQNAQHQLFQRPLLCIADPMELGRSLGTSFQGGDRWVFELRRACHILEDGRNSADKKAQTLFTENRNTQKNAWRLYDSRDFPPIFENEVTTKIPINSNGRDLLLGNTGGFIKELQGLPGMRRVKVEGGRHEGKSICVFSGTPEAVRTCKEKFQERLFQFEGDVQRPSRQQRYAAGTVGGGGGGGGAGGGGGGGGGGGHGLWVGNSAATSSWAPNGQAHRWERGSGSWDYSSGYGSSNPRRGGVAAAHASSGRAASTLQDWIVQTPAAPASKGNSKHISSNNKVRSIAEQTAALQQQGRAQAEAQATAVGAIGSRVNTGAAAAAAAAASASRASGASSMLDTPDLAIAAAAAARPVVWSNTSHSSTPTTVASTPVIVTKKSSNKISKSNKIPRGTSEAGSETSMPNPHAWQ